MPISAVNDFDESFAPAGWYADPLGVAQLRWWNGIMWTDRVKEPPSEPQAPVPYKAEEVSEP